MNAATLHYNKNNAPLTNANEIVLVDGGCEFNCYASDITRCFPVGKTFSEEARVIYSIVLDMQKVRMSHKFMEYEKKKFFFVPLLMFFSRVRIRPVLRNVRLVLPGKIFTTLLPMLHVMVC
jgi:hypothetical protein